MYFKNSLPIVFVFKNPEGLEFMGWNRHFLLTLQEVSAADLSFMDKKGTLNSILDNPKSLDHRWGDLPVIGVALKVFADWKYNESILLNFNYNHYSHRSLILNGNIDYEVTNKFKLLVKSIKLLF
jgi:hypothetical protein